MIEVTVKITREEEVTTTLDDILNDKEKINRIINLCGETFANEYGILNYRIHSSFKRIYQECISGGTVVNVTSDKVNKVKVNVTANSATTLGVYALCLLIEEIPERYKNHKIKNTKDLHTVAYFCIGFETRDKDGRTKIIIVPYKRIIYTCRNIDKEELKDEYNSLKEEVKSIADEIREKINEKCAALTITTEQNNNSRNNSKTLDMHPYIW